MCATELAVGTCLVLIKGAMKKMRFAVLTADQTMVDNVIVARADQKQEVVG